MYTARDVMTTRVIPCPNTATVEEAIKVLLNNHVSGAPVVTATGELIGIISEYQLLEIIYSPDLRHAPVTEFMTKEVHTVSETTLLSDVASTFIVERIRRLPVIRDGQLVGIISRPDLLRYALESNAEMAEYLGAISSLSN